MRVFCLACLVTLIAIVPAAADYAGGQKAYKNGNFERAFQQWLAVADKGDVDAQYNIAVMYQKGQGVTHNSMGLPLEILIVALALPMLLWVWPL